MKVVLDTNVFVSGILFAGFPGRIIEAWLIKHILLQVSLDILEEYHRVSADLAKRYKVNIALFIERLAVESTIWNVTPLKQQVCTDPDDDKFLACAIASGTKVIVSGDKALLDVSGFQKVTVIRPREFVQRFL